MVSVGGGKPESEIKIFRRPSREEAEEFMGIVRRNAQGSGEKESVDFDVDVCSAEDLTGSEELKSEMLKSEMLTSEMLKSEVLKPEMLTSEMLTSELRKSATS